MFVKRRLFQDKQTNNNIQTCHQTTPSSPKRHHCRSHVNEIYYYYYYYYYYSYSLTVHYIKKQNVHTVVYLLKLLDWDHLKLTHQASLILIFEKKKINRKMKKLTLLNYYQAIPITNLSLQRTDCWQWNGCWCYFWHCTQIERSPARAPSKNSNNVNS